MTRTRTNPQDELEMTRSQLALYAKDLKRVFEAERAKSRDLAAAKERLERLDQLKTAFLMFISHELRTPLSCLSLIDTLEPGDDAASQAQTINTMRAGYTSLDALIRKGLAYFDWAASDHHVASDVEDARRAVERVSREFPILAATPVDFRVRASRDECLVRICADDLDEIVRTLIDNAIKFSPGEKRISVNVARAEGRITLTVVDSGCGFAPEMATELLRPFTIADARHHSTGTGLSLALANAIASAHGGEVLAESEGVGGGATFRVLLPEAIRTHDDRAPSRSGEPVGSSLADC